MQYVVDLSYLCLLISSTVYTRMTNLVDVHILHLPNENQDWWKLCEESLRGHPINVHNLEGIVGDFRAARRRGYEQGSAPYVTYVDPDDIVLPGAYQACISVLEADPSLGGAHTNSQKIDKDGNVIEEMIIPDRPWDIDKMIRCPMPVHQVAVVRRSVMEQAFELVEVPQKNTCVDYILYASVAAIAPWYYIPIHGYQWRIHDDGYHHTIDRKKVSEARKLIRKLLSN